MSKVGDVLRVCDGGDVCGGGGVYFPNGQNIVWRHALAIGCLALIHELMWGNF